MTDKEKNRVKWLLGSPVCEILRGVKIHLSLLSIDDLVLLCKYFNYSIAELVERFWNFKQDKPF